MPGSCPWAVCALCRLTWRGRRAVVMRAGDRIDSQRAHSQLDTEALRGPTHGRLVNALRPVAPTRLTCDASSVEAVENQREAEVEFIAEVVAGLEDVLDRELDQVRELSRVEGRHHLAGHLADCLRAVDG